MDSSSVAARFSTRGGWLLVAAALSLLALPRPSAAQAAEAAEAGGSAVAASPTLPADHWAVGAARRAEALGLAPGYLPAQTAVPRHVVEAALRGASSRAAERGPQWEQLTDGWLARFDEEFAEARPGVDRRAVHRLGSHAALRFADRDGGVQPGRGVFEESRTGAAPLEDSPGAAASIALAARLSGNLVARAEPVAHSDGVEWRSWELRAGWRSVSVSAGRMRVGYGYAPGAGLVLSGAEAIDGIQFETLQPVRLPGPLARLGAVGFHAFGSRLDEPRHPGSPYFWGLAGSLQPHPRVTASVHRASIMAGDSVATPLTLRNFLRTFVGHNLLGFENEVVAAQLRLRLPTEPVLPLTLYGEWGAEDAAGAWRDVPGRLVGISTPALPGMPQAAMGLEYVAFAGSCCGNPPWYRHAPHTGGWVGDQRPLGHPLGGQGRQATIYVDLDLLDARLRLSGRGFARRREGENLYVPGRDGASTGIQLRSTMRVGGRGDLGLAVFHEGGPDWSEQRASLDLRAFF